MRKLKIHCPYRYKECLETGCNLDKWDVEQRRILSRSPYEFCSVACEFYARSFTEINMELSEQNKDEMTWYRK